MENNPKRYNAGLAARYKISENIIRNCQNPYIITDIGCGDGYFTARLSKLYKDSEIVGFDTDDIAIRLAIKQTKNLSNISFVCGNAFEHAKKTDLIVATDVIEHLYKPDEFMMNCFKILTSGGYVFLSTPIRYKEFPDDKYHVHEFFYTELEDFSKLFNFTVIEHKYSHAYCYIEKYSKQFRFMGMGKMRLYKYMYNFSAMYFGINVFENSNYILPTMQYILLRKGK